MLWTVRTFRFDNKANVTGAITHRFATKREALEFMTTLGIKSDEKKVLKPFGTLISRIGHTYNVALDTRQR